MVSTIGLRKKNCRKDEVGYRTRLADFVRSIREKGHRAEAPTFLVRPCGKDFQLFEGLNAVSTAEALLRKARML